MAGLQHLTAHNSLLVNNAEDSSFPIEACLVHTLLTLFDLKNPSFLAWCDPTERAEPPQGEKLTRLTLPGAFLAPPGMASLVNASFP